MTLLTWIARGLEVVAMTILVGTITAVVVLVCSVFLFSMYVTSVVQTLCDDELTVKGLSMQMRMILNGMRLQVNHLEAELVQT